MHCQGAKLACAVCTPMCVCGYQKPIIAHSLVTLPTQPLFIRRMTIALAPQTGVILALAIHLSYTQIAAGRARE